MDPTERYELIRRKNDLAQRMIVLGARTSTVMQWAGFTDYRVQQIARRFAPRRGTKRWGNTPYTARYYGRSPEIEAQSLAFVCLATDAGVIPEDEVPDPRQTLPGLHRGEKLLEAFRCYTTVVGGQHLSFERAIALVYAIASRTHLDLRSCRDCGDVMLTPRIGRKIRCPFCRSHADVPAGANESPGLCVAPPGSGRGADRPTTGGLSKTPG